MKHITYSKFAIVLLLSLLTLPVLSACKGAKAAATEKSALPPRLVEAITLRETTVTPTIESIGKAQPVKEVLVSVEMSGKLTHMPFDVGDHVKRGELLARVRTLGLWSQRKAARANVSLIKNSLEQSKRDLQDTTALYKKGIITKNAYDMAVLKVKSESSQLRSAKATYGQINDNIGGTSVTAPFDGEVALRQYEAGTFVMTGSPLLRVVDLSSVKVKAGLTELDVANFRVGDKVSVSAVAWPGKKWTGTIHTISPAVDARSGLFPVEVILSNKESGSKAKGGRWLLREGMTMKMTFNKTSLVGLFVPSQAVIERNGKPHVWVRGEAKGARKVLSDKTKYAISGVKLVPVQVGEMHEGWFRITSGLSAGDMVITTGVSKLRGDAIVRLREITPSL